MCDGVATCCSRRRGLHQTTNPQIIILIELSYITHHKSTPICLSNHTGSRHWIVSGHKIGRARTQGMPQHKTCPMQCAREGTVFWLSHSTLMLLVHSVPDWWGHTPLSPPIKVQTCHQDGVVGVIGVVTRVVCVQHNAEGNKLCRQLVHTIRVLICLSTNETLHHGSVAPTLLS